MTMAVDDYYDGFRTFSWLADLVGLPIDQVNFVLTQFTALILATLLRSSLNPIATTPAAKHVYGLTIGLALGYFCFGRQAIHLASLPALCYVAMRTQNPRNMQRVVLAIALIYLSCIHFHRQIYDYGSYTLDITGPLMVITQKVTSLAFSIHDGLTRCEEDLTPMQRHQAIQKMPTTLEYFSYIFHFQALMAGPVIFYRDYIDFIHGHHLPGAKSLAGFYDKSSQEKEIILEPSPTLVVVKKVAASLVCAIIFITFIPIFPIQYVKDDEFLEKTNMFYKLLYLMLTTMLARFKYYHAWLFADAICNNSGFGFNGYDERGKARWDLVSNVDVFKFETSLNLKDSIDSWNKGTNLWLRSIMYERAGRNKVIYTYALSALWHGFYPGYYLTFASAAFFTVAARSVRRYIRPMFLESQRKKIFYDVLTFITTKILMAYMTFSFILLEFVPSIKVYLYLYLLPHLFGLIAILLSPHLGLVRKKHKQSAVKDETNLAEAVSNGNAYKTM
ncbi:Membrane-bound O-acyltransferase domain-containing protein 2 [Atta colombica]|uniref:Membrane-bound O-acyltransferase domain-containing protein 2 n=1 Tax=Atta colombica TaxID=520822 RepID=A0A151I1D3_9HYME|nr:PREDICTED: lysophospholipid acyltransferase 2 [Atta colombica]KYM79294.1 Membrane-bound O-acyltransferase domain-containing protein 2 [Atta colombica]